MKTLSLRASLLFPLCCPSDNWSTTQTPSAADRQCPKREEQKELRPPTAIFPVDLLSLCSGTCDYIFWGKCRQ